MTRRRDNFSVCIFSAQIIHTAHGEKRVGLLFLLSVWTLDWVSNNYVWWRNYVWWSPIWRTHRCDSVSIWNPRQCLRRHIHSWGNEASLLQVHFGSILARVWEDVLLGFQKEGEQRHPSAGQDVRGDGHLLAAASSCAFLETSQRSVLNLSTWGCTSGGVYMYLVFTRMPGESYRRRLGSLLWCFER